jgi:excinuclease ABC subunit B
MFFVLASRSLKGSTALVLPRRAGAGSIKFRPFSSLPVVSFKDVDDVDTDSIQTHDSSQGESRFRVTAKYAAAGDQPAAIEQLTEQLRAGDKFSILRGITGTGKTFVMSHLIANANKPCLVLCHNKTLAAQLARELRSFLSENAVELFVSYYNHYVPEAYVEATGKYIGKKSSVNAEIDALRHRATRALLTRSDVVVVASVSCIYGLGMPKEYLSNSLKLVAGTTVSWQEFSSKLENMLYDVSTDDEGFARGQYQLEESCTTEGSETKIVVLWPPHERFPMQIQLHQIANDTLFRVAAIRVGSQAGLSAVSSTHIFPAKHHVISEDRLDTACLAIEEEMRARVRELSLEGKHVESDRLQQRVANDLMILRETGFCAGGENYSRHFAGREAGEPPDTLMDYLGLSGQREWLLMVDESHVTLPQLSAMYAGDQARKRRLVKHGYRLPSALDNRPLQASEFWDHVEQAVFVSATPSKLEIEMSEREPVEMVIRPTFVCDPVIEVRPSEGQLQDLLNEVKKRALIDQRTLAVALTKRDAEDLSSYLIENGVSSTYIHSGLTTHERSDALKALQSGEVDCLVGVNLLREGLDLPQVSLVAILSADSEGFLRSETALFQTIGRAARNIEGTAILYAKRVTDSMRKCIDETKRRRTKQQAYNLKHELTSISTKGSSTMSIFDLAKDEIDAEISLEVASRGERLKGGVTARDFVAELPIQSSLKLRTTSLTTVTTDHIPSSPGVYIWRDSNGGVLYIGKAANLRSRVRSYHAKKALHSSRIKVMLKKAVSVDFVLTPSERDALVLESNLIKHHQPPFNVLLKDDEHYPYICASCGDAFPRLFIAPRKLEGLTAKQSHRYFGPYTNFKEINLILERVEAKYDLRAKSFLARHGSESKVEYQRLFDKVMQDVFTDGIHNGHEDSRTLRDMRIEYEEAGLLFDSKYNQCRDVVAVGHAGDAATSIVVHVLQLREGLVAGRFSYTCQLPSEGATEDDYADAIHTVLANRHYPSGGESRGGFSWFPDDVLLSHEPFDIKGLRNMVRQLCKEADPKRKSITIRTAAKTNGPKREVDDRALEFATKNAHQAALNNSFGDTNACLVDGSGATELAVMIGSKKAPSRIECYVSLDHCGTYCGAT